MRTLLNGPRQLVLMTSCQRYASTTRALRYVWQSFKRYCLALLWLSCHGNELLVL